MSEHRSEERARSGAIGGTVNVHHRYAEIDGHQLFYREAGPADAPTLVLLHGFPTSSFMFRELIPALADRYHLIAPDHLGFGFSEAPSVTDFDYTFDNLAALTWKLLRQLGVTRYALYAQDYGAPVGWRLAIENPEAITAIISQNGNAYEAGLYPDFWTPILAYGREQTPELEAQVRSGLETESIKWQYTHGVPDASVISPDTWTHDAALVQRPGNDLVQLELTADYINNLAIYPKLHEVIRSRQLPVLAVWGRNDEIFAPAGAEAFAQDTDRAQIELLDGGHFLLESHLDQVAELIGKFLGSL